MIQTQAKLVFGSFYLKVILRIFMHRMHSEKNLECLVGILQFSFLEQKSESKIFWILILASTFNFCKVNGTHLQQFITRTTLFSLLNFSLSFFYFPFLSFIPYFFSFFDVFPIFFLSFFYLSKRILVLLFCIKELGMILNDH